MTLQKSVTDTTNRLSAAESNADKRAGVVDPVVSLMMTNVPGG